MASLSTGPPLWLGSFFPTGSYFWNFFRDDSLPFKAPLAAALYGLLLDDDTLSFLGVGFLEDLDYGVAFLHELGLLLF